MRLFELFENDVEMVTLKKGDKMVKVDFSQVSQSSGLTCRRSLDDTLFVITYPTGVIPTFINTGIIKV